MTERLPNAGEVSWQDILGANGGSNGYLRVAHNNDGTLKSSAITSGLGYTPVSSLPWNDVTSATYGADKTGVADSAAAIQAAIDALGTAGGVVYFPTGNYKVNSTINVKNDGVHLVGQAHAVNHFGSSRRSGDVSITWGGGAVAGPVIDFSPDSASGVARVGGGMENIAVFCSPDGGTTAGAAVGIRLRANWTTVFSNVAVKEGSTACWQMTAFSTGFTGGNNNNHNCQFYNISAASFTQNGIPLQTTSPITAGGTTLSCFFAPFFHANNATACMDLAACDDLYFYGVNTGVSGTAHSLELRGKDVANGYQNASRNIHFFSFFPGAGVYVRAGDGTNPSHANVIWGLSFEDGDTPVTVESGASAVIYDTRGSLRMLGPHSTHALDFYGGTYTAGFNPIRLPNNVNVVGRNAADSADVNLFKINTVNELSLSTFVRPTANINFDEAVNVSFGTTIGTKFGTATTQKLGFWGHAPTIQPPLYTTTNATTDRTYDANATTIDELADVLGTLIADLKGIGLIG